MSDTRIILLAFAAVFLIASLTSFASGWKRGYKENPTNPWPRGAAAWKYLNPMGFFFAGCTLTVATVGSSELWVRALCAPPTILMFLNALFSQKRSQGKIAEDGK